MATRQSPGNEVEIVQAEIVRPLIAARSPMPTELESLFTLEDWAQSLINHVPYAEPDPDYLSRMLLMQTITADTVDQVLKGEGIRKLQESIPNVPGASTGPVEINDLYVTGSDFGEGAPCYIIFGVTDLETGVVCKYTTGATQLQAQILTLLKLGTWPIRGKISRTERKDKGGRYLFWLFPPD